MKLVFKSILHKLGRLMILEENILSIKFKVNHIVHKDAKRFDFFLGVIFNCKFVILLFTEADNVIITGYESNLQRFLMIRNKVNDI